MESKPLIKSKLAGMGLLTILLSIEEQIPGLEVSATVKMVAGLVVGALIIYFRAKHTNTTISGIK